jgi:single-stranded-DNA-specific exonuclease
MNNQNSYINGQKYRWLLPSFNNLLIEDIMAKLGVSRLIAMFLVSRGKLGLEAELFLQSSADSVPPASLLKDCAKAVDRVRQAIENKEKILIVGDYDVDGITSTSMLMTCVPLLGADINFYLPNRVKDGYGLSVKIVEKAAAYNYKVIITVDNGISAVLPAQRAKELGIDLIITDHHRPQAVLPPAYAIVDPHQADCQYPYKYLAGVGVTFKFLCLLFESFERDLPTKVYELLLLGTVADVVPLTGENRYWVKFGLNHVNGRDSIALNNLKLNSNCNRPAITSSDIGFFLAPQINALGRLDDARDGVYFLIGSDEERVAKIGQNLKNFNEARKEIEKSIFEEVEEKIKSKEINLDNELIIIAGSKNWPAGVIGLVASRIVAKYGRPTILLHITHDGVLKGSCRSINAFNMFDALQENANLLMQFGGHSVAAGLALIQDNLQEFKSRLETKARAVLTADDLVLKVTVDGFISTSYLDDSLLVELAQLEPFGHQNESPLFVLENLIFAKPPILMKSQHVKCFVKTEKEKIFSLVFFNRPDIWDLLQTNTNFDALVKISENFWQGEKSLELIGIDIHLKKA